MDSKYKLIIDSFGKNRFKFKESLKDYTESGVGGPAELFFIAFTAEELVNIVSMCRELQLSYFLFGTGSKIMISDSGIEGLVIKNRTKGLQTISVKGKVTKFGIGVEEALVEVESGVSINKLIEYLNSEGLESSGFINMPGSVGGNLPYSLFLQTIAKSIKVLDLKSEMKVKQINIGSLSPKRHIIISAVFKVKARNQI